MSLSENETRHDMQAFVGGPCVEHSACEDCSRMLERPVGHELQNCLPYGRLACGHHQVPKPLRP